MEKQDPSQWRVYHPYHSPFDPCPARPKHFIIPPNETAPFQTSARKQYSPHEALRKGTLWPDYYSPYPSSVRDGGAE
ncbi:spore coat associated protein CotJA [Alicyclobacillus acidiphilus]|uniref:spore coat associated protein CotJA n=1 Tax=Alicyclobacillus acidiphilus TaxID=182455 RepID=UPI000835D427|nr:spore coat associated protein CotJA [Alicyclobacillus acidiphilus]